MSEKPELYLQPKEIANELCSRFGICVSVGYIYEIRKETLRRGEQIFVIHSARASDVYEWMKRNPQFRLPRRGSGNKVYST